ncbi:hypothetical protein LA07_03390, partial [Xanthomonas oryzae pv. oryzae]
HTLTAERVLHLEIESKGCCTWRLSLSRMPVAKALGQTAPFAAMLCDVKKGVDYLQVGHADIAALQR